jgi:thiamine-phosphate pyrophosphorylase
MQRAVRAPRLMMVADARRARWPLPSLVAHAVAGGVDAVYARNSGALPEAQAAAIAALRERIGIESEAADAADGVSAPWALLINGDPERARALGVGLHLRERDISPAAARALLGPEMLIGKAVHDAVGASRAAGADYLLAGHVYPSPSKPGMPPLGLTGLTEIVAAAPCPVLAIGGITPERVAEVIGAGAHGVAVIGAIAEADNPRAAAAALRTALDAALQRLVKEST